MAASKSTRRRKKSGTYHHGNLREALVAAALDLISEVGPRAFTLRETARRARVSHAAPYRHFADKEALLAAVAEQGFQRMSAALRAAEEEGGADPVARFQAQGAAYVRFAVEHPSHLRIMFGADIGDRRRYPSLLEAGEAAFRLLVDAIARCQRAGSIRSGDPAELAILPWSAAHGLAFLVIEKALPVRDPAALAELSRRLTGDLLLGLGPR